MVAGRFRLEALCRGVFFKSCVLFGWIAGMAEVVKGAGLKIRSRMGSWVRIPLPAPLSHYELSPS